MCTVFSENALNDCTVQKWFKRFSIKNELLEDTFCKEQPVDAEWC